jgi:hypothetical protein
VRPVALFGTILLKVLLVGALLMSILPSSWWGELAGIAPGFHKISLSGLMAFPLLMIARGAFQSHSKHAGATVLPKSVCCG